MPTTTSSDTSNLDNIKFNLNIQLGNKLASKTKHVTKYQTNVTKNCPQSTVFYQKVRVKSNYKKACFAPEISKRNIRLLPPPSSVLE